MGFKTFYLKEIYGYSLEDLLLEARILLETNPELETQLNDIVSQLRDPSIPPEKKRELSQELNRLKNQKRQVKQQNRTVDPYEANVQKFAQKANMNPIEVDKVVKQTVPSKKHADVLLNWWEGGKFEPKDSTLTRQLFTNYEQHGEGLLPLEKYDDPKKLESALDQVIHNKEQGGLVKEINDKPIYSDDNIDVFHGSDRHRCIKYGKGKQHTLCVAQPTSSNLYLGYRSKGATFYFIYFKNEGAENNQLKEGVDFIVIHVYPDHMEINHVEPNDDIEITEKELLSKFPKLKPLFDKGILEHKEHTDEEKEQFKIDDYVSILECENYKELITYVELGKLVKKNEWGELEDRGYKIKDLVNKYMNTGVGDIPYEIIDKFKFRDRYEEILKRRVDAKKGADLTPHEYPIIDKMDNRDEIIQGIAKDSYSAFGYAQSKGYQNIEPEIIQGIAKDSKYSIKYAKAKGFKFDSEEEKRMIIQGIAKQSRVSYQYAYLKGFQNIEPEIIQGLAQSFSSSFEYAKGKGFKFNSEEEKRMIIQSIVTSSHYSYKYAIGKGNKFGFENIEPEIMQSIAKDSLESFNYAREIGFENLDLVTDAEILKTPQVAYEYAKERGFYNIEPEILKNIANDPMLAFKYAKLISFDYENEEEKNILLDGMFKDYKSSFDGVWDKSSSSSSYFMSKLQNDQELTDLYNYYVRLYKIK